MQPWLKEKLEWNTREMDDDSLPLHFPLSLLAVVIICPYFIHQLHSHSASTLKSRSFPVG